MYICVCMCACVGIAMYSHMGLMAPLVGHNAVINHTLLREIKHSENHSTATSTTTSTNSEGYTEYWSENKISEDFDLMIRGMMHKGASYYGRYVTYPGYFLEGVTASYQDEYLKVGKFAFGGFELMIDSLIKWDAADSAGSTVIAAGCIVNATATTATATGNDINNGNSANINSIKNATNPININKNTATTNRTRNRSISRNRSCVPKFNWRFWHKNPSLLLQFLIQSSTDFYNKVYLTAYLLNFFAISVYHVILLLNVFWYEYVRDTISIFLWPLYMWIIVIGVWVGLPFIIHIVIALRNRQNFMEVIRTSTREALFTLCLYGSFSVKFSICFVCHLLDLNTTFSATNAANAREVCMY